eukprot:m.189566 g.189566  ORF g.189566 m.189566 type:complete len:119 (-) comp14796_c0_seq1:1343-1699(-)
MCRECVVSIMPDRGMTCLDTGAYMANFKGCKECGSLDFPTETQKQVETEQEDDGSFEETTTLTHSCKKCGHKIGEHTHTFGVDEDGEYQEYTMTCILCGRGADTHSVAVFDPREEKFF